MVPGQGFLELGQDGLAMLVVFHVDEVDDDDAPRLRRRSWRAMVWAASRLVLKMVSSKLRTPTKPPVLTSMVVIASVWSMMGSPRLQIDAPGQGFFRFRPQRRAGSKGRSPV